MSVSKTENLRHADGVVGVSHYVADYVKQWSGIDAIHVPISLLERVSEYPDLGSFDNPYVSMVNPCAVKGITIFLELADRLPHVQFAAVPTGARQPRTWTTFAAGRISRYFGRSTTLMICCV